MPPTRVKRSQSALGSDDELDGPRCKRQPPPSPDLYSVPPAVIKEDAGDVKPPTGLGDGPAAPFDEREALDIRMMLMHSPNSKRGAGAVEAFVERALAKGCDVEADRPAVLDHFVRVTQELGSVGCGADRAVSAHTAMVEAWQEKVVTWLGASVYSTERLAVMVMHLVRHAEHLGGLAVGPQLRQDLFAAFDAASATTAARNSPAPPVVAVGAPLPAPPPPAEATNTGPGQANEPAVAVKDVAERGESMHPSSQRSDADMARPPRPLRERFPDPHSFYVYHARKVTHKVPGERRSKAAKRAAKAAIDEDWRSLPPSMQAVWTDRHATLLGGDDYLLKADAVAELFQNGRPRTSYPLATIKAHAPGVIRSSGHVQPPATPSNMPQPFRRPACDAPPKSSKVPFTPLTDAAKKVYLSLDGSIDYREVAKATCFAAKGFRLDPVSEYARYLDDGTFVISFESVQTAQGLAGKRVSLRFDEHYAWSYPSTVPQMFVAQMDCTGPRAVRRNTVHPNIALAFPRDAFHLRKERSPRVSRCWWLVMFERPPGVLRFTVPVLQVTGGWHSVRFDPVTRNGACPACSRAHAAPQCDLLTAMSARELGVSGARAQYLAAPPPVKD